MSQDDQIASSVKKNCIQNMTYDELKEYSLKILTDIAQIKNQLEHAKEDRKQGHEIDHGWRIRANHALKMKGIVHQLVASEIGKKRRLYSEAKKIQQDKAFINFLKIRLGKRFLKLVEEFKETQVNADEQSTEKEPDQKTN